MLKQFKYKDIIWLDLESPTEEELTQIGTEYKIHPLVINELQQPSLRTKVDLYNDYLYLILHFPVTQSQGNDKTTANQRDQQEIDFVISKDFIITAHYEPLNTLYDFAKIFEVDFDWKKGADKIHAGFIFFYILRELYSSLENGLHLINDQLKRVEKQVFSGREREVVEALAEINHELLDYRWSLKSHREVLTSLEIAGLEIFGQKFSYYLKALTGEQEKLQNILNNLRETFTDLSDTNDSLLTIKTNNIMRALTVAAFVFLPLSIIPQIFGISSDFIPFQENPYNFYIISALMVIGSSFLYLLARNKKWF
jgi:magnesium transporter